LPWECDEERNENNNECEVVQTTFESLENCQKAQSNVYSDIYFLLEGNTDTNANEGETIVREAFKGCLNDFTFVVIFIPYFITFPWQLYSIIIITGDRSTKSRLIQNIIFTFKAVTI
jgi:hypothetical protein